MAVDARPLPDQGVLLRECTDFIAGSRLSRRALADPHPPYLGNFVRDLVEGIHRLQLSCHLPEFTDHGLTHLCSLIHRVSTWTVGNEERDLLPEHLPSEEAAILLVATLIHDIGMLSQKPEDMPKDEPESSQPRLRDVPSWVRLTHVDRLPRLFGRLMSEKGGAYDLQDPVFMTAIRVACAHYRWPDKWENLNLSGRCSGLAAVLAVTDLLDEDTGRVDTATMLDHREGNSLNYAHWLRHSLTVNRLEIREQKVQARLCRLPGTTERMSPVYSALRNHYRMAYAYNAALTELGVGALCVRFDPDDGLPRFDCMTGARWKDLPGFATEKALVFQLLRCFSAEALLDVPRGDENVIGIIRQNGGEPVDLSIREAIAGKIEARSEDEQTFHALLED